MPRQPRFALVYAPETLEHLDAIEPRYLGLIERTLEEQLIFAPDRDTRNRKPLEAPAVFGATWELRFGPRNRFRALYAIDPAAREVQILAIGVKEGNRLRIGGKEIEL